MPQLNVYATIKPKQVQLETFRNVFNLW